MLSVDVRVVSDKDDLLAVNLDDKPGGNAAPELPSERNSSTLEVVFVYFAGYGILFSDIATEQLNVAIRCIY